MNENKAFYAEHESYKTIDEAIRDGNSLVAHFDDITVDGIEIDATIKALVDIAIKY